MAIRYQLVNDGENIKNKLYFIVLAFFTVSMTATFSVLCIKRQYGEYRGPFLPGVCEPWWNDDTNPPVPVSMPTNAANCGPKKSCLGLCKRYADRRGIYSILSD